VEPSVTNARSRTEKGIMDSCETSAGALSLDRGLIDYIVL